MKCPDITPSVVISDDAELAALSSCFLSERSKYLTVLDGPRMPRDDREAEIIRRNNVVARVGAAKVVLAGLPSASVEALSKKFSNSLVVRVDDISEAWAKLDHGNQAERKEITWGTRHIGVGLLKALRTNAIISFADGANCDSEIATKSGHLVVCEAGEPISEVIAANYAYSLGAGLKIIPKQSSSTAQQILEGFYSLYDQSDSALSPSKYLEELGAHIRSLCGPIDTDKNRSLTFVSKDIPYGFAFPEVPSTHLFTYPDLGLSVANGFVAERKGSRGTNVSVLVDPEQTPAPEIKTISRSLSEKRGFVRSCSGVAASVTRISNLVDLFPYDLLIFATHCGDAPGHRWTYEFPDSRKRIRRLVVDIALGVGHTREKGILKVTKYQRFHELDGVNWLDSEKHKKIDVGTAIRDFVELDQGDEDFHPVKKELLDRVLGSSALKMSDNNYLPMPNALASNGTPIIINNACSSWQNLAGRFIFAGCRGYVGTLFPVSTIEADHVLSGVFGKQWGKTVPHAFWSAQNAAYGDATRRPYIVTGVYCSRLRVTREDVPKYLERQFTLGLKASLDFQDRVEKSENKYQKNRAIDQINYYKAELAALRKRYKLRP